MTVRLLIGDCRERLAELEAGSVDSCVCDPPYHLTSIVKRFAKSNLEQPADKDLSKVNAGQYKRLARGFMGQQWDGGDVAFQRATWEAVWRVLKPGAHLVAFSGTRTYHRMVCAIEDAGFEIRDQLGWVFGSGFPKSHDVSKGIDRMLGAAREVVGIAGKSGSARNCMSGDFTGGEYMATAPATPEAAYWQGWGTALKPAWEPICLARKPLAGTVAQNVLKHGTGAINIDGCRIGTDVLADSFEYARKGAENRAMSGPNCPREAKSPPVGRWPANIIHDGSEEVLQAFPDAPGQLIEARGDGKRTKNVYGDMERGGIRPVRNDSGSSARFFYCAKASSAERGEGNGHPTVKPVDLMRWLVRLVTPKGGTVLDPFAGSGSTLIAADAEQFNAIGCELSPDYAAIAERRVRQAAGMFADISTCARAA